MYFVTVTNESGCTGADTAEIKSVVMTPAVALPADTMVCEGTNLTIRPNGSFSSYLWSDGSTNNTLKVSRAGTYSVEVIDANNCKARDSIAVNYKTCVFADQVLAAVVGKVLKILTFTVAGGWKEKRSSPCVHTLGFTVE